ncbi:hypothetical protein Micbo1qcDRAFT_223589 [Microdochium bolleyi]|uniref:PNPLA domain-containing protein n=1 Tax=Microdochium bolleyi TaxID=196109 RepID=A0A136IK63_9PEZI|nr:hypothetical protein Micbo1qcDRAFT_223589 [Microdochium bolleyi]
MHAQDVVLQQATSKQTSDGVCLTSYRTPRSTDLLNTTKVWQACRATSAATTFFEPIAIGVPPEEFVDGALGMNNPIFALWSQAQDVWGDRLRSSLRCLELATETERTAELFRQHNVSLDDDGRYFRFNVAHGLENVGLEEANKQAEIGAATRRYLQTQDVLKQMAALTNALARRQYLGPYKVPFSLAGVPVSAKFVDRPSDTTSLEEGLLPRRSQREGKKVFVLHGLGGIGKTQLAVDFTRRHQAAFSTVFWLDGRAEDRLRRSIAGCVERIPEGQIPSPIRQQAEGRSAEDLDAAVVGDSAEGGYDVRKYVPWDHGAVLITTRLSRLVQLAAPGYSRKLVKVDGRLGRAILETWYGGDLGPGANDLLTLLDGLPLALAQAASYLRETGASIAKYLEIYRRQWDKLMASGAGRPLLDYDQGSIATTWTVSFGQIEAKDGPAASLLRLWAFLDNKHLWHGFLTVAGRDGSGKRKWPQWLLGLAVSEVRFLEAVGLLLRYSMIEANEDVGAGYSMHPVVHKWASHLEEGSRKADYARLALTVVGLSVPMSTERDYWVLQQQLLPHGQRCAEWVQSDGTNSLELADEDQLEALHNLGNLYADQGRRAEAEAMYQRALAGYEKALGPDHPTTRLVLRNLKLLRESIEGLEGGKLRKRVKTKLLALFRTDRVNALKGQIGGNDNS